MSIASDCAVNAYLLSIVSLIPSVYLYKLFVTHKMKEIRNSTAIKLPTEVLNSHNKVFIAKPNFFIGATFP